MKNQGFVLQLYHFFIDHSITDSIIDWLVYNLFHIDLYIRNSSKNQNMLHAVWDELVELITHQKEKIIFNPTQINEQKGNMVNQLKLFVK